MIQINGKTKRFSLCVYLKRKRKVYPDDNIDKENFREMNKDICNCSINYFYGFCKCNK